MCVFVILLADVNGHCHLGVGSGCWWTELTVKPTAVMWAGKGSAHGITVGVEVMWSVLVKGQT